jgi:tryptophan halogenase
MDVPESLARRIALFRHSGVVEQYRDGLFTPPSWLSVFVGQGLTPQQYSPLADATPLNRSLKELEELHSDIRDRVDEMPKHASFIARYANSGEADDRLLHEAEARL